MAPVYTVTRLSTTPVKGLIMHHPDSVEVSRHGVAGDRVLYLLDDGGTLVSCTRHAALLGLSASFDPVARHLVLTRGTEVVLAGEVTPGEPVDTDMRGQRMLAADTVAESQWSAFFSDLLGKRVRLLQSREPAYDVRPVTLLGSASVEELGRHLGGTRVDARRFRMLVEFSGGSPHVEDTWAGRLLHVGGTVLRAGGLVKRCAATTRNPESGDVDLQTLRAITGYRGRRETVLGLGVAFGIYGDVVEPGTISLGDVVEVAAP